MRTSAPSRRKPPPRYVERINLAIDHATTHLAEPLRLERMARAAGLSPFHFHRVFQALVGETPADFVKRLRLERALAMMAHGKKASLTDIALSCGFASSSDFSRSFKQRYGASPRAFDLKAWLASHASELESHTLGASTDSHLKRLPPHNNPDGFRVRIRDLPARTVAYIRVDDPYKDGAVVNAVERLVAWAERRGVADAQWLGYQWDNPEITPLEQCRYYVAVEADGFAPRGEIGRFRFPAMTVADVEIRGTIDLELRALQWLYREWLPRSRYVPDDQPGFEAWIGRPFAHGFKHFEIHAQLPVRRA